ncbi:MAG: hypothetical protein ACI8RZ_006463, partial [Myxococcota bacterium]
GKMRRAMESDDGKRFQFPEGCTAPKARISFIEQQDSILSVEDLLETPDLQEGVTRSGERHLSDLKAIEECDDASKLLAQLDRFTPYGWPDPAECTLNGGAERAFLRRLGALAFSTLIEPASSDPVGLPVAAQLAVIRTNEDIEVAAAVACIQGISPGVRQQAMVAWKALDTAKDNIRFGLHWIRKTQEKPWLTLGALAVLACAAEKLEAKEAAEEAEKAWLESALKMDEAAAIVLAGAESNKKRLLAWLAGEQRKGPKQLAAGSKVRVALRKRLTAIGVVLAACPNHAGKFMKSGDRCPVCWRSRSEVLAQQAREKTEAWQEKQRLAAPQLAVGCWIEVKQTACRSRLKPGQRWKVRAVSSYSYTLQRIADGKPVEEGVEVAFFNALLGREVVVIPAPDNGAAVHIEADDAGEQYILPGASLPVFSVHVLGEIVLDEDGEKTKLDGAILRPTGPRSDLRTMPLGDRVVVLREADYHALLAGQVGVAAK